MRLRLLPRTVWGLAAAVAVASSLVTVALGMVTFNIVHHEIERQIDQRIEVETQALLDHYNQGGLPALAAAITARDARGSIANIGYLSDIDLSGRGMGYLLVDANGLRIAGAMAAWPPAPGWTEFLRFRHPDGVMGVAQAMNTVLPSGDQLIVAGDRAVIRQMDRLIQRLFMLSFGAILLAGLVAAAVFGRVVHRRLVAIQTSAEGIMAGDLSQRMALDGSGGEFDRLATVLNRMLDRIGGLMANLRQVSSDIAHDMRTPLNRLRGRLEAAETASAGTPQHAAISGAIGETDDLLDLFASLLAISEVEGQSARARFKPVALDKLVAELSEAYAPAFESAGMTLRVRLSPVTVSGEWQLLQRCLANLLDNAIVHAGAGATVEVACERRDGKAILSVRDDGPGVPVEEHARMFERLTRLDRSRTLPGHGLGLSMVAAIAAAHGGGAAIEPTPAGLAIRVELPLA